MKDIVNENIKNLKPYKTSEVEYNVKLDANENPYEIPKNLDEEVYEQLKKEIFDTIWNYYPDASYDKLREEIAKQNNLEKENIILGNGSDEIILNLMLTYVNKEKSILVHPPTFSMYKILAQVVNGNAVEVHLDEQFQLNTEKMIEELKREDISLTFITYPNNPTGNLFKEEEIEKIIMASKGIVIIDEAYYEFAKKTFMDKVKKYKNVIVLRTFSKAYGIAGLRVGYMAADISIVEEVNKVRLPYNLNKISELIALKVYKNKEKFEKIVEDILLERDRMYKELKKIDILQVFHSDTNSIFLKTDMADEIFEQLLENGILIRKFGNELKNYLRISIAKKEENDRIIEIIKSIKTAEK